MSEAHIGTVLLKEIEVASSDSNLSMLLSFTASFCVEEYIVEIVKSNFTLVRLVESFDLHGFISFINSQQDLCMALTKQSVETLKGAFHEKLIDISLYGSLSIKFALLSKLYS